MKIYVIAHKDFEMPVEDKLYDKLFVGANGLKDREPLLKEGYIFDDTGENISARNGEYCELTGLYWMWKNSKEPVVGLCHYRRFFTSGACKLMNLFTGKKKISLSEKKILKILNKNDIIMHNRTFLKDTVRIQYSENHDGSQLDSVGDIIKEYYPDYYSDFEKVMNRHFVHFLNMFIMRKELMDEYCEWIFGVLFKLESQNMEKKIDTNRLYGFLSEILFDVWVEHKGLKVREMFSINLERIDMKLIV